MKSFCCEHLSKSAASRRLRKLSIHNATLLQAPPTVNGTNVVLSQLVSLLRRRTRDMVSYVVVGRLPAPGGTPQMSSVATGGAV